MKLTYLFIFIVGFLGCNEKVNQKVIASENQNQRVGFVAKKQFGDRYALDENDQGSHVIIFQKRKKLTDLFPTIHFFIYDKINQENIYQDVVSMGSVSWVSNSEINVIERIPKTKTEKTKRLVYRYDVLKKERIE